MSRVKGTVAGAGVRDLPLVEAVTLAQRRLARGLSLLLTEEGTTLDQFRALRALSGSEGLSMGGLADALLAPHPTVTRVVEGLVDAGLVYRRQSDSDRRRVTVHLSRRGADRLTRLAALVAAHEATVVASEEWAPVRAQLLALLG